MPVFPCSFPAKPCYFRSVTVPDQRISWSLSTSYANCLSGDFKIFPEIYRDLQGLTH
jgi:hypothetical protein